MPSSETVSLLLRRFGGATVEMLNRVLTPYRLKITDLQKVMSKKSKSKFALDFKAEVTGEIWTTFEEGTTGKVVPREYVEGEGPWREIIKARVLKSDPTSVEGELYFSPARYAIAAAEVKVGDYLEIDPFGVTSKVESALAEAAFFREAEKNGFTVIRMPENVAKHVGTQNYFDFKLEKEGKIYWVELKSLWGTDTTKARLIHTVSRQGGGKNSARKDRQIWKTSSCRFKDQDIFAVSLWLRTGKITDFAYALSAPSDKHANWGLPKVPKHPDHVTQNPTITSPPSGSWTESLPEVCGRVEAWRALLAKKKATSTSKKKATSKKKL